MWHDKVYNANNRRGAFGYMRRRIIFSPVEATLLLLLGAMLGIGFLQAWIAQQQQRHTFSEREIRELRRLPIP
jgi:hypothetical protein